MDNKINTPKIAEKLLRFSLPGGIDNARYGDFEESFRRIASEKGKLAAHLWYWMQLVLTFKAFVEVSSFWKLMLIKSYIKSAWRNITKYKLNSFINISGLSIGITSVLLIFVYISHETGFDNFHENSDNIYRVSTDLIPLDGENILKLSTTDNPVGMILKRDYSEIENVTYVTRAGGYSIKHNGSYNTETLLYADNNFLKMFTFPLIDGSREDALLEPYSMVITKELSKKYFSDTNPIGKTLTMNDSLVFTIKGVAKDIPKNSSIQFGAIISYETYLKLNPWFKGTDTWGNFSSYTYIQLKDDVDVEAFKAKTKNMISDIRGENAQYWGYKYPLVLENLNDLYLYSGRNSRLGPVGSANNIYVLMAIAFVILSIACINFMNLSTARSGLRAKEIGMRKVLGSNKSDLIKQFLSESILLCTVAVTIAIALGVLLLPQFNTLTGSAFLQSDVLRTKTMSYLLGFIPLLGIISGAYPAFVLSSFKPIKVLAGPADSGKKGIYFRRLLVVIQFSISIILIITTLTVSDQLNFMVKNSSGFDKEQVIVIDANSAPSKFRNANIGNLVEDLKNNSLANYVSASTSIPGRNGWIGQVAFPEGQPADEGIMVEYIPVDPSYIKTFGMKLVSGNDFEENVNTRVANSQIDIHSPLVINEAAVKIMGWTDNTEAIGKKIESPSGHPRGTVVGVIKNYNHHTLKSQINPIVMSAYSSSHRYVSIKFNSDETEKIVSLLGSTWAKHFPGYNYNYFFLDDDYARNYESEQWLIKVFGIFASLALIISCLGLLGLTTFIIERRAKEISIRKVLGATIPAIFNLIIKEFGILIMVANLIAWPIAYVILTNWLENFAYKISPAPSLFILSGIAALIIGILTVGVQSFKTLIAKPVDSLRND